MTSFWFIPARPETNIVPGKNPFEWFPSIQFGLFHYSSVFTLETWTLFLFPNTQGFPKPSTIHLPRDLAVNLMSKNVDFNNGLFPGARNLLCAQPQPFFFSSPEIPFFDEAVGPGPCGRCKAYWRTGPQIADSDSQVLVSGGGRGSFWLLKRHGGRTVLVGFGHGVFAEAREFYFPETGGPYVRSTQFQDKFFSGRRHFSRRAAGPSSRKVRSPNSARPPTPSPADVGMLGFAGIKSGPSALSFPNLSWLSHGFFPAARVVFC